MTYAIRDREIFASGTHNGIKIKDEDLEDIVAAAKEMDFRPAIKMGHNEDVGAPAFGYVENIRRVANKIIADFVDLPQEIYEAIQSKRFERVSAEILLGFKRAGKTYRKVLGAIALLGAEIPGVSGLKPLHQFGVSEYDGKLHTTNDRREFKMTEQEVIALKAKLDALNKQNEALQQNFATITADAEATKKRLADTSADLESERKKHIARDIEAKVSAVTVPAFRGCVKALYQAVMLGETKLTFDAHSAVNPSKAIDALVDQINKSAKLIFTEKAASNTEFSATGTAPEGDMDVGSEVQSRVQKYRSEHPGTAFKDALRNVLNADQDLKARYTKSAENAA